MIKGLSLEHIANTFPEISVNAYSACHKKDAPISRFHIHNEIELMYVCRGTIGWDFPAQSVTVGQGQCIFANSRTPHSTYALEDCQYFLVQFSRDKLLSAYTSAEKYLHAFILEDETDYCYFDGTQDFHRLLIGLMQQMFAEIDGSLPYKEIFLHAHALQSLGILLRQGLLSSKYTGADLSLSLQKILPVIEHISHSYQKPVRLEGLSSHFGFTPSYLCRLFKKATGKTISEYLNFIRIEKSLPLLVAGEKTITEVALQVGFSNISYFNSRFRSQIGCSPTHYRKNALTMSA